jgi:hypothetical protein
MVAMVAAIAAGRLDGWSGRFLHVNNDAPDVLGAQTPQGEARRLRLRPYGDGDPFG